MLTGSTCARSAASDRRRRIFSTSASHHWSPAVGDVGEFAAHQAAVDGQPAQHVGGDPQPQPEPGRRVGGGERAVGARIAAEQLAQRVGDGFGEARRDPDRHRHSDAVAQQADVFDGDPPGLAGERHRERPLGGAQTLQPAADVGRW